ncbi:hypothetical protein Tco_1364217, partial [Tanacetum coccineum]
RLFKTLSLDESRSLGLNLLSDLEEAFEEEEAERMAETTEQYMSNTRTDYGSGVVRPKIEDKDHFELKGQFLKELRENTFSSSNHEDANEHIEKVLEVVDLFHVPNITVDQLMLRVFPISLTGDTSCWLRNKPTSSIKTWEELKTKFLNKYCPPARTATKMDEINNFQKEPDETLFQSWENFKELLMKCPQHYLTEMQEDVNDVKDYTKVCPLKEEGKTLEEAYYKQFGSPFQGGEYRAPNQGASIKTLEIQIGKISKLLQERGFGILPSSTKPNPRDYVKSISNTIEADTHSIRRIRPSQYVVSASQNSTLREGNYGPQFLEAYGASHINQTMPHKEKDPWSFTLPCYINNVCFDNSLADLRASVSVMPLSTYLNLGLGELAHIRLIVELADKTVKYPKGIAENVLVGISKFVFPVDFIILDMPEDIKVTLILERPFLSTAHAKIDVYK